MPDPQRVKNLFTNAAQRYNCVNTVLSLGIDRHWRQSLARAVAATKAHKILDIATGSGVLSFAMAKEYESQGLPYEITGADFCEPLLEVARADLAKKKFTGKITFIQADALQLPLPDRSVDALTVAFGLRNFESRPRAYTEMRRVLKPGGQAFILEFSQPVGLMKPFYHLYDNALPTIAGWLGQDKDSYQYLKDSVRGFPAAPALAEELKQAGFTSVGFRRMTGGIVALHQAVNPA